MTGPLVGFWLRIAVRSGRLFAPFAAATALLAFIHSGGASPARAAYATAAALLFPVQVWLAQQVVSAVPPDTRRVLLVAVDGRRRMLVAVLTAAAIPCVAVAALALVWPWLAGAVPAPADAASALDDTFGVVACLALVPAAAALGVVTSEVSAGTRAQAAVAGTLAVLATVLIGFGPVAVAVVAPPLIGLARLGGSTQPTPAHLTLVVVHSVLWSVVAVVASERRLARRW